METSSKFGSMRTTTIIISSIGAGLAALLLFRRIWSKPKKRDDPEPIDGIPRSLSSLDIDAARTRQEARVTSRARATPSISERGSTRRRNRPSSNIPPVEADLMTGLDSCHELIRSIERAVLALDLVRNRSDMDRTRADLMSSVVDRLRFIETDISRAISEGGFDDTGPQAVPAAGSIATSYSNYQSPRAGTLSVLSDDSFMSAFEEFAVNIDEDVSRDYHDIEENEMLFYKQGLEKAASNEVQFRKARADFCQCDSDVDFAAKLWCLRQAFEKVFRDAKHSLWVANCGRTLLGDILKHSKQDPGKFYRTFDDIIEFFQDDGNVEVMEEELSARGVKAFGFYDIVLDFILLDSFDDLKSPPSSIYSVTKNYFLSYSMKYSTISTVIWSMLKAKRQRLKYPNGFIAHFYNLSETVSPAITLGFLGTDDRIGEMCQYFKEQITQFMLEIFNAKRVRYTSLDDLADDLWVVMESRMEALQTRIATELIPI